ncbi:MAG: hypothetical protein MZV49_12245 [Rhodopseudomonas palustris]|nr:hypothetical protein [Rhodopseudomonas palustris]
MMDKVGNKVAQARDRDDQGGGAEHGAAQVIDWAIQAFGGAGVSRTTPAWPSATRSMRTLRLADGPDEVHNRAIARLEMKKYANAPAR